MATIYYTSNATPYLTNAYNVFDAAIQAGAADVNKQLGNVLNTALTSLSAVPGKVDTWLKSNNKAIPESLAKADFDAALVALQNEVNGKFQEFVSPVSTTYDSQKTAAVNNFNTVVTDANKLFTDTLNKSLVDVMLRDPNYASKTKDIQTRMQSSITNATNSITQRAKDNDAKYLTAQSDTSKKVADVLAVFVSGSVVASDATPVLDSLFSQFDLDVSNGVAEVSNDLDASLATAVSAMSQIPVQIIDYLKGKSIKYNLDGADFRKAVSDLQSDVDSQFSNLLSVISSNYETRKSSVNSDLNTAVSNAQNSFVNSLSRRFITDPDFSSKYSSKQSDMQSSVTKYTDSFSDHLRENDVKFNDAQADIKSRLSTYALDFALNHPILRNVGNVVVPLAPVFDDKTLNDFSVDFTNIGNQPWNGYIGVGFTDEYRKKFVRDEPVLPIYTINPGETKTIKRSITIPPTVKVIPSKGKNIGKQVDVPWGKTLTYIIKVFTRLS